MDVYEFDDPRVGGSNSFRKGAIQPLFPRISFDRGRRKEYFTQSSSRACFTRFLFPRGVRVPVIFIIVRCVSCRRECVEQDDVFFAG